MDKVAAEAMKIAYEENKEKIKDNKEMIQYFESFIKNSIFKMKNVFKDSIILEEDHYKLRENNIFSLNMLINSELENKEIIFYQILKERNERLLNFFHTNLKKDLISNYQREKNFYTEFNGAIKNKININVRFLNYYQNKKDYFGIPTVIDYINHDIELHKEVIIEKDSYMLCSFDLNIEEIEDNCEFL